MSEFDTGYSVTIGKPVVHAEKKAAGESVSFPCEAIPDGSYLVSLEVNGSVKAYRESMEFSSGSCTVGDYTLAYSSYALAVSGTSNNDIVRVMVEPLEVKTTDAFRAAVKKDAPKSEGGGSGGGGVVHAVISGSTVTLDKTWQEIFDGDYVVIAFEMDSNHKSFLPILQVTHEETYYVTASDGQNTVDFYADSASGYPSATIG